MTHPLDPDSVADYLLDHPRFFEEQTELLARIKITSPLLGRAVSLQERQMEILREKIKLQELHTAELLRHAVENDAIANKFQAWTRSLLLARHDTDLPQTLTDNLRTIFHVPQVTLRLWDIAEQHDDAWFTASTSEDARLFAKGLTAPFCGPNSDYGAATWLADAASVTSLAMLPLRIGAAPDTFGLLVLGSPDPGRFAADMGTEFLSRIGETASAALACLRY